MIETSLAIDIDRVQGDSRCAESDRVAVEEPLEIQIVSADAAGAAAKSISVTMRTPGNDVELALGFLYAENVIESPDQVADVVLAGQAAADGERKNVVRVELHRGVTLDLGKLDRHFYTTSSCGVCGKASIDALNLAGGRSLADKGATYSRKLLLELPDKLLSRQELFGMTGGLHAAAVFDQGGRLVALREDVGRHNAVDKVVGSLMREGRLPAGDLGLLVSGRASFELVQKALVAGLPTLVAVGAPSSLAVELARSFGMTLVGFLRGDRFNIYAGGHRIQ